MNDFDHVIALTSGSLIKERLSIHRLITHGSSGARIALVAASPSGRKFAIKFGRDLRVPLALEIERKHLLEQYVPERLPEVYHYLKQGSLEITVWEHAGSNSLLDLIYTADASEQKRLLLIWSQVMEDIGYLWMKSQTAYHQQLSVRNHTQRIGRIADFIKQSQPALANADWMELDVRINGRLFPCSNDLIRELMAITAPKYGVTCHGDPIPHNIVLDSAYNWRFVDFEWVGMHHDWRMMIAQMYGSWLLSSVQPTSQACLAVKNGEIQITIAAEPDERVRGFQNAVRKFAATYISGEDDIAEINKYLSTLYLGHMRFDQRALFHPLYMAKAFETCYQGRLNGQPATNTWGFRS